MLTYSHPARIGLIKHVFSRYFFAFCLLEEVYYVVTDDKVFLLIVNC